MNSDSGLSSQEEGRDEISSEEFVEMEPRICYDEYQGDDWEMLIRKEQELEFRKTIYKKEPTLLGRAREIYFHFLNRPSSSLLASAWSIFIFALVIASIILLIVRSWPTFQNPDPDAATVFFSLETFIAAVFTFEYLSRLLVTYKKKWRFVIHPLNVIDLLSFLPYYIELIILAVEGVNFSSGALRAIRAIRLVRLFRILKLERFSGVVSSAFKAFRYCLPAFIQLFIFLSVGLIIFSSCIYFAEQTESDFDKDREEWIYNDDSNDPGKLSPYQSIPASIWWSIVTMTTVGYGDTFPITPTGKMVAGFTMLFGLLLLAFPVGVLGTQFSEQVVTIEDELATQKVLKAHRDKIVEAKIRALRKELAQIQKQAHEFDDICCSLAARAQDMLEYVEQEEDKV